MGFWKSGLIFVCIFTVFRASRTIDFSCFLVYFGPRIIDFSCFIVYSRARGFSFVCFTFAFVRFRVQVHHKCCWGARQGSLVEGVFTVFCASCTVNCSCFLMYVGPRMIEFMCFLMYLFFWERGVDFLSIFTVFLHAVL